MFLELISYYLSLIIFPLPLNLYDTPGIGPRINILFWGLGDFPLSYPNRNTSWNAWNGLFRKFNDRYGDLIQQYEVSLSRKLNNIWPAETWPVTVTSQPIRLSTNLMTLIPRLTFTELRLVSIDYLQRLWHDRREHLLIGHRVLSLFMLRWWGPVVSELVMSFRDIAPWIPLCTFSIVHLTPDWNCSAWYLWHVFKSSLREVSTNPRLVYQCTRRRHYHCLAT